MRKIRYSYSRTGEKRKHYLLGDDVDVLLSRLPGELWERLRAVHFNDRSQGARWLGYVTMGRRRDRNLCLAATGKPIEIFGSSFTFEGTVATVTPRIWCNARTAMARK